MTRRLRRVFTAQRNASRRPTHHHELMKSVLITIILLSIPLCTCVELHACYGIDCGSGLCFERGSTGYVCICHDGYEGDRCQRHRRLTRGTSSFSCDDATPCQNGGTCIETSLDDDKDDYDGEAPVDMDGEAPLDGDDMMLDCSVEGNCYICLCGPEFTGVNCSEPTGLSTD